MIQIIQMKKGKYRYANKSNKSCSNKRSNPIELPFAKELVHQRKYNWDNRKINGIKPMGKH
jgi:hypothetical protein